jgi:hypothetical protein
VYKRQVDDNILDRIKKITKGLKVGIKKKPINCCSINWLVSSPYGNRTRVTRMKI